MSENLLIMLLTVVVPFLQVLVVLFVNLIVLINLFINISAQVLLINLLLLLMASETLRAIVKCKNKFYDVWVQFLILFSLVTLNYGYLSFNMDCYYLKANTTVNNLTTCLIFIKYHIYNFSDCIGKIFFKVLFFYSNLYQCFLISIHFFLVCKLASIL